MLITVLVLVMAATNAVLGQPSDAELQAASEQVWAADSLRFPEDAIQLDRYSGANFFSFVDDSLLEAPVYQLFEQLATHYNYRVGEEDQCNEACEADQDALLDEMFSGEDRPMQVVHAFLRDNGLAAQSEEAFKRELKEYWFTRYSRGGSVLDSSGFEHAFLGEVLANGNDVSGFHNWVRMYREEQAETLQYLEYQATCQPDSLRFAFRWNGALKPVSSMWIGTSPEAEMALYTLCFQARQDADCPISLDGELQNLVTRSRSGVEPRTVNTAYPGCNVFQPSQEALDEVSESIWAADVHRFPEEDIDVNINGPILFTYVNEEGFEQPIYSLFRKLFDHYQPSLGVEDTCDAQCLQEREDFLDELFNGENRPMQIAHRFLADNDLAAPSVEDFKTQLRNWWFRPFTRTGGPLDTSGFKHVFNGEISTNGQSVGGFHNWMRIYLEEQADNFEYGQYQATCEPFQVKFSHDWLGATKPINSAWIGSSPEVEFAMYTLCFQSRQFSSRVCDIRPEPSKPAAIQTYVYNGEFPKVVATAYVIC